MSTTVGVKLDAQTRHRLKKLGKAKDRSTHWLMKEAIERYLEREEQYEREKAEDNARWERYLETGSAIDSQEMTAWLHLGRCIRLLRHQGDDGPVEDHRELWAPLARGGLGLGRWRNEPFARPTHS